MRRKKLMSKYYESSKRASTFYSKLNLDLVVDRPAINLFFAFSKN